jgi:hypothetical protein
MSFLQERDDGIVIAGRNLRCRQTLSIHNGGLKRLL